MIDTSCPEATNERLKSCACCAVAATSGQKTWLIIKTRNADSLRSTAARNHGVPMLFVPSNGAPQAIFKPNLGLPTQSLGSARNIEATPGLSVGFGAVPANLTLEIGQFDNELNQILDGDFHVGAKIHWDWFIKNLGGPHHALGRVFHVQEFS